MNQKLDPDKIGQLLERSTDQIDSSALAGLRNARMQALSRYDAHSTAPAFAWAGIFTGSGHSSGSYRRYYYLAAAVLLAASLFSVATYWQQLALEHDDSDVDIAILTDDMPVDVYVD